MNREIASFFIPDLDIRDRGEYLESPVYNPSDALKANAYYFNHPLWACEYLRDFYQTDLFKNRWLEAMGDWSGKIVVDIGCGPGNVACALKGNPELLIGVDIAPNSLQLAAEQGYIPVFADAARLPFVSGFADIVILNATLHHCEHMAIVLKEAARIVKAGGLLITDHDPQLNARSYYKGFTRLIRGAGSMFYQVAGSKFCRQLWRLAAEIHHKPGHGVTRDLFSGVLGPLGFEVNVYPHNHTAGAEVLQGKTGRPSLANYLFCLLTGGDPMAHSNALSLMCVARKHLQ